MVPDQPFQSPTPGQSWGQGSPGEAPQPMSAPPPPPPPPGSAGSALPGQGALQRPTCEPAFQQPVFSWNQQHWQQQRLEQELAAAQDELQAMRELLEDLPEIFERKFQGRLQPLLEEQHRLLRDNTALRQQLLQLHPQAGSPQAQPLLPPAAVAPTSPEPTQGAQAPKAGRLRGRLGRLLPWGRTA